MVAMMHVIAAHVRARCTNVGKLSVLRLTNPKLFIQNKANKFLVFEEPKDSFFQHNKKGALEKLGKLAPDRMQHIKKLHVIQESESMAYLVKHAGGCHYELYFSDIVAALEITPVDFKVYWKETNYCNNFIVLISEANDIQTILQRFNFQHVEETLSCQPINIDDSRQKKRTGFGFSSSINTCHEVAINTVGSTEPRKRAHTYDRGAIQNFLAITNTTSNLHVPWLDDVDNNLWEDPRYPNRTALYANQIHNQNKIEAMYYAETDFLQCHTDTHNASHSLKSLSPVFCISRTSTITNERTVIIGTMRKAICNVLKSVDESEQFINDVANWINDLPPELQTFQRFDRSYKSRAFQGLPGYEARVIPSHVDPQSFYQIYRWYCMQLASRFRLSYVELVSLQTTFDLFPKSHYYFAVAAESLLRLDTKYGHAIISRHRGYRFGFFILNLMFHMQGRFSTPPCRFNDYKSFELPTYNNWMEMIDKKCACLIHVMICFSEQPEDTKRHSIYKKSLNLIAKKIPNADVLIMNHSIAIMSSLGLLPKWFMQMALIDPSSKYMKWFADRYSLGKLTDDDCRTLCGKLQYTLNQRLNTNLNLRQIENILCKFYRVKCPTASDTKWCDLVMERQPIVTIYNDEWEIKFGNDEYKHGKGSLILAYPCGERLENCYNLPFKFGIGICKKLLAITKIHTFKPTEYLIYNRFHIAVPVAMREPIKESAVGKEAMAIIRKVDKDLFGSPIII